MLDQQLPEDEKDVAEHKNNTFLDALKGLEAARKYVCQIDIKNNIIAMCIKV